tara:strand:+ start:29 stop:250 length:222 start_codon:yes stop_codon:yes gene_type:complete
MELESVSDMKRYVSKYNYIVIFPDKKIEAFKSLRDIQDEICISHSTISKKLIENGSFIFTSKEGYVFYIHSLK